MTPTPDHADAKRAFQCWLAMPEKQRTPPTQKDLAAQLGVHENSLVAWKKLPGFMDGVQSLIFESLRSALPAVLENIAKRAASGDRREWVDLYLSLIGGAAAVAGANASMTVRQTMTDDEAAALLERSIGLKLTARVASPAASEDTPR